MNILDRAISFFDPVYGLQREAARANLRSVRAVYDGAAGGRRGAGWRTNNASANVAVKGSLAMLRSRSRDVVRNTWWGPRIVSVFTGHAVGTGIMPICEQAPAAAQLWREWGAACDAEGQLSIDGLIALACRSIVESGEVLARFVPLPASAARVPLEIQLLEPDHLDPARDTISERAIVDQGIEYDARGKRAGYWLLPEHPGARGIIGRSVSLRVPAQDVLHVYRKERIGQGRGVPWVARVLLKGKDIADLEEAISVKARIEACLGVLIKSSNPARTLGAEARTETASSGTDRRIETLSPGMIKYLENGEDVVTVQPTSGLAFEQILIGNWMTLAAGAGLTYDQVTGDLRQANYSSLRAGKIEFRRLVEQFQYLTIVDMLLNPVWRRFIATSVDSGALPYRTHGYPVSWIMPANEPIDPLKDMQADVMAVRTGRMTWNQFVASWGLDPKTQMDEIAKWLSELDAKNVVLDTDPRRALKNPKTVSSTDTGDAPAPKDKDNDADADE